MTYNEVLSRLQAELDKHTTDRERAWLIAEDWSQVGEIEAMTAEEVHAAYAELDTDMELKSEDYETLDELNGVIGGLELAIKIVGEIDEAESKAAAMKAVAEGVWEES